MSADPRLAAVVSRMAVLTDLLDMMAQTSTWETAQAVGASSEERRRTMLTEAILQMAHQHAVDTYDRLCLLEDEET